MNRREIAAWITAAVAIVGLVASLAGGIHGDRQKVEVAIARLVAATQTNAEAISSANRAINKLSETLADLKALEERVRGIDGRVQRLEDQSGK